MKDYIKIQNKINKMLSASIECSEKLGSIRLEGKLDNWESVVKAGFIAAKSEYREVINDIQVDGTMPNEYSKPSNTSTELHGKNVDVLIIGGGIIGCSIARELSRYKLDILLIEKEYDVAVHASSRNDGMIHDGFAAKAGSLKSKYNVRGNAMYDEISKELDVKIIKNGSLILFDKPVSKLLYGFMQRKAEKAGVPGTRMMAQKELREFAPFIDKSMDWAFFLPSAGVTSPYKMTVAYAENAIMNGVQISLNTVALSMKKDKANIIGVVTNKGTIKPKIVINAAGVCSDLVAEMANDRFFTIHPRKGEIALLDKKTAQYFHAILGKPKILDFSRKSKGGGIIKTAEDNLLIGPNNFEVWDREDYSTNRESLDEMLNERLWLVNGLKKSDVITYFAGTRAATYKEDFIIERSGRVTNLIHVAGIQSPGFASAPAIAEDVKYMTVQYLRTLDVVEENTDFVKTRKAPIELAQLPFEERSKLIALNPDYGQIVCRCEEISKGEVIDALNSPLEVNTVDGIKRRTRAGMGRCQGGFCLPHIMEIISEVKGLDMSEITKKSETGQIVLSRTKENNEEVS